MFKLISELLSKLDEKTRMKVISDAAEIENSLEIKSLITTLCDDLRLNKFDKGIQRIIKKEIMKVNDVTLSPIKELKKQRVMSPTPIKELKKQKVIPTTNEQTVKTNVRKSFFNI